jgi:hypothetical protein
MQVIITRTKFLLFPCVANFPVSPTNSLLLLCMYVSHIAASKLVQGDGEAGGEESVARSGSTVSVLTKLHNYVDITQLQIFDIVTNHTSPMRAVKLGPWPHKISCLHTKTISVRCKTSSASTSDSPSHQSTTTRAIRHLI